jgi:uridine kinase
MPKHDINVCMDLFTAHCRVGSLIVWLLSASRLVTVEGPSRAGKTSFVCGLMDVCIASRWSQVADEYRFFYQDAQEAFDEIRRLQYDSDSNFDSIIKNTGLLALDNFDELHPTHRDLAASIINARCDKGKVTVLIVKYSTFLSYNERLYNRMLDGRTVTLGARG